MHVRGAEQCRGHLCWSVELEQQSCLAGKQVLAEVELRHPIATHHAAPGLPPGCLQDLSGVIPISLAA